ncbi:hypothetical protein JDV09_24515 [Mycobacterium sp. Y57]|uniref:hypothetical protein n=1 Tax=Mycolicibacterium xanthum TaxID=2796469 RepID=UPI001C842DCE|nr:hypothetical protein [Mycolicibacterium xanthum]MBX7435238.1 hypothetical protein [Mycolicibacterium xanthum]
MNEARRRRKAKQARRDAQRDNKRPETPEETPLIDEVRRALAGHPLDLLGTVGMLIEATKPDPLAWLPSRPKRDTVDLEPLLDGFIGVRIVETTALLAVLAELLDDTDLQLRCRREVAARRDALPGWIADLGNVEAYQAVRMTHVLGDGDELLIGARLSTGDELTGVAFIDHNGLSAVKDAFFVPDSIDTVVRLAAERNTDPDTSFVDMSLADTRAWIEHGLRQHAVFMDQTETWPACRPLLQWLISCLPPNGAKYQSPRWDPDEQRQLCDEFFDSDHGAPFDRRDYAELLDELLDTGDPVRWSVPRIERVLRGGRQLGSTVAVDVALDAPELLTHFIPFAHAQSGIRDELTAEALDAVDDVAERYRDAVLREVAEEESED